MLTAFNTYRHFLLGLLLLSYLLGAFPNVVFEGLHLGAHAAELLENTYHEHSFHDHGHDHHHAHLEVAKNQQQEQGDQPVNSDNLKKKIEISDQGRETTLLADNNTDNNFGVLLTPKTHDSQPLSPPPKVAFSFV